jgi:hypothetical protein
VKLSIIIAKSSLPLFLPSSVPSLRISSLFPTSSVSSSYSSPPWLGAVKIFSPTNLRLPITFPSSLPLHSVEPGYGDDVYEADYLLLFHAADLSMDPVLRPRPVSSVAFAYLGNAYNSTTRLNDGIFTVHRFSIVTSARLHQSECVFRLYVYRGIFDNPPGLLSARGTDCFCYFVFFLAFIRLNVNSGALIPRRSTAHGEGRRMSFVKGFIIGYLLVVHVFCSLHIPSG